jgi:serine/threonine protein kinase
MLQSFRISDLTFEVPSRYTLVEPVGQGAYGVVVAGIDTETKEKIAVKRIEGVFDHLTFARRTLRELRILRHLRHENVTSVRDVFVIGNRSSFGSVYVISDLMETDLASILKSGQVISPKHITFFVYQMFRGLKYLQSVGVVHRDLKLRNLFVNGSTCDLRIGDYGLSRVVASDKPTIMTEYTCTRWFRAPEILLGFGTYDFRVDVWSAACILAEMISRKPLFPGQNTQHQLQIIVKMVGSPEPSLLYGLGEQRVQALLGVLDPCARKNFHLVFPTASAAAVELLDIMLQFDFHDRPFAAEVLEHEYFADFHDVQDEPEGIQIPLSDFEFDRRKLDVAGLRAEIFWEAAKYRGEAATKTAARDVRTNDYPRIEAHSWPGGSASSSLSLD